MRRERSHFWIALVPGLVVLGLVLAGAWAGSVSLPHSFVPGTPADANQVNANFQAVAAEVGDNDQRIADLEADDERMIHVPARGLPYFAYDDAVVPDYYGLSWPTGHSAEADLALPAPPDYAGGDVTVELLLVVNATHSGIVDFMIRAGSSAPGAPAGASALLDVAGNGVKVEPTSGSPVLHVQTFTVGAEHLSGALWFIGLRREGSEETYDDLISLVSVSVTYPVR